MIKYSPKQESISVECQPLACRQSGLHTGQVTACWGGGLYGDGGRRGGERQTNTTETIAFPQLRWQAVIIVIVLNKE